MARKREKCRTDSLLKDLKSWDKFVLLTLIYTTYNQLRAKGLTKCVRYTKVSFFRVFFSFFFTVTGLKNIVIPSTLLYGGSLYRGSTVQMPTLPPSRLHHFEHLYPQFTLSIDIGAFASWGRGGGRINQTQPFLRRYVFTIVGLFPMLRRLKTYYSIRLLYPTFRFFKRINNNFLLLHG